jgi:hypothetical protein
MTGNKLCSVVSPAESASEPTSPTSWWPTRIPEDHRIGPPQCRSSRPTAATLAGMVTILIHTWAAVTHDVSSLTQSGHLVPRSAVDSARQEPASECVLLQLVGCAYRHIARAWHSHLPLPRYRLACCWLCHTGSLVPANGAPVDVQQLPCRPVIK